MVEEHPHGAKEGSPPPLDLRGIGGSAYAGVFEMGLTFVLWMRALSLSRTTAQVSNLVYFSPFLSLILINVIVGETIRASSVIGLDSRVRCDGSARCPSRGRRIAA